MGRENRARRAAKARERARARARGGDGQARGRAGARADAGGWRDDTPSPVEQARGMLLLVMQLDPKDRRTRAEGLRRLADLPSAAVDTVAEQLIADLVDWSYGRGWQPVELVRQGRIGSSAGAQARLVAAAVAADHAGRDPRTLDPRWVAQVESLGLPTVEQSGWVATWVAEQGIDRYDAAEHVTAVLANLDRLVALDPLLPPPGVDPVAFAARFAPGGSAAAGGESDPVLERIRALLAKAESTTFEAEATAFTAKAQELMTRHAVDAARLAAADALGAAARGAERPVMIRVPVDAPYVDAKSLLLQTVAQAGRCKAVMLGGLGMSTVVGFPSDLAAVELLFTSLLVQAQTALADAAKRAPAGTRVRSQSYRSAFLVSYAHRIGERLDEVNATVLAEEEEAESGGSFLPVLSARAEAVDDLVEERFGALGSARVRSGWDTAGSAAGRAAADQARLTSGELDER